MESVVARLQLRERGKVRVCRVDADARPDVVRRLRVREVPSIVIVKDVKPLAWLPGRATLADIEQVIAAGDDPT
jgi:thioredoxin-like negative regulator of GroEL